MTLTPNECSWEDKHIRLTPSTGSYPLHYVCCCSFRWLDHLMDQRWGMRPGMRFILKGFIVLLIRHATPLTTTPWHDRRVVIHMARILAWVHGEWIAYNIESVRLSVPTPQVCCEPMWGFPELIYERKCIDERVQIRPWTKPISLHPIVKANVLFNGSLLVTVLCTRQFGYRMMEITFKCFSYSLVISSLFHCYICTYCSQIPPSMNKWATKVGVL